MHLEERKQKEIEHSDRRRTIVRAYEYHTDASPERLELQYIEGEQEFAQHFGNMKFYSIARASFASRDKYLLEGIEGLNVLDYCCGNGEVGVQMAHRGARSVHGIDLSPVAIENARALAGREGVAGQCVFEVMDAEHTEFPDSSFDVVHEYGALHHLDLNCAYEELARILKPGGKLVCTEALRHNPFIHRYRKRTPHLRTQWEVEHILGVPEILRGRAYFESVHIQFFHLVSLAAVPFRKSAGCSRLLSLLEGIDGVLLRLPGVQRWAWVAVVVFTRPRKPGGQS
ncbi:MAG: class I SAM-dependent methyltransferase [Thermodesulfobacteriota bacterium]